MKKSIKAYLGLAMAVIILISSFSALTVSATNVGDKFVSNANQASAYDQFFHPGDTQFGGDGTWKHYYKDTDGTYKLMTYKSPSAETGWQAAYIPSSTDYVTQVKPTFDASWNNMGTNYYFAPQATVTEVARGFKAPETGRIKITTLLDPCNGMIYDGDGFSFKVLSDTDEFFTKNYGKVDNASSPQIGSTWDYAGKNYSETFEIDVTKGETIYFDINCNGIADGEVVNTKYTVEYLSVGGEQSSTTPTSSSTTPTSSSTTPTSSLSNLTSVDVKFSTKKDFTQGLNNWYFYYKKDNAYNLMQKQTDSVFWAPFGADNFAAFQLGPNYKGIVAQTGYNNISAVRAFKAPATGKIKAKVWLNPWNGCLYAGDGVTFSIYNGNTKVYPQNAEADIIDRTLDTTPNKKDNNEFSALQYTKEIELSVTKGDMIYFTIGTNGTNFWDVVDTTFEVDYFLAENPSDLSIKSPSTSDNSPIIFILLIISASLFIVLARAKKLNQF